MQDAVRPSDETFTYFYERGYRTWFKLYQAAFSSFQCAPSLNLENVIPQHPYFPAQLELDRNSSSSLYATGIATWGTTEGACNLPSFKKRYVFGVTTVRPTVLSLSTRSSSGLPKWFGEEGNHTSVLTLAWAYVLSARWTEVIPGASAIQYTDSQALWLDDDGEFLGVSSDTTADGSTVIDLGDVTSDAARWWAAVLAPEEGWNACIPHNNRLLKSPWSVTLRSDQPMVLLRHTHSALPVSSIGVPFSTAARYIFDYARYHSVADQSHAAFTAALLLPMSQSITKQVCLPSPRLPSKPRLKQSSTLYSPPYGYSRPWGKDDRQLDRLLTLSCTTTGITSLLSSIFVESDIPCNVCGAWVQGAFAILTSECAKDPHVLAHMFMNRSPKLGFLWLGGILIGIQDYIMRWARPVAFLVDLHAAAWTTTSISGGVIRRSDEARLMFLSQTEHHAQPPIVPFGPFGTTAIKDCVLEVQLHAQCQGYHGLSYVGWAWDCQNKTQKAQYPTEPLVASMEFFAAGVDDVSGSNIPVRYDDLNRERDCSESVTRNMFLWLREVDGFPVAERAIYEHEWIDGWDSDESAEPEGDGKSTVERYIGPWISRTMTQRCYSL
ncbi:hypothetical protein B0T10DRAFT_541642 [Thelonectria olida]|uniref:Immunoglobulin variable region used by the itc63b heavy chain n=1 Tax=Thelonectria olida TaxID=1576542 RepID=A0A9P9AIC7_9HYPO|nr:hypothetical protein B0T10DRAFT_541642 [Thelonectria olida]